MRDTVLQALFLLIVKARQQDDADWLNDVERLRWAISQQSQASDPWGR